MSKPVILLLALLTAALTAYVIVFERDSVTSKELSTRAGRVLTDFVRDKVDYVSLQRKGQTVVVARVKDETGELGGWQLREPVLARADTDAIDPLLGELEWVSARRTFEQVSDDDLVKFGLDKPRYRLTYRVGGRSRTLRVGHPDVHDEGVYVKLDDEPRAYVVPKTLLEPLDHDPGHFRDKHVFPSLVVAWERELAIERGETRIVLSKDGEQYWLEGTPRVHAIRKKAKDLFELIAGLRAARYLEGDEAKAAEAALASPSLRVTVRTAPDQHREDKQPERFTLEAAGPCGTHEGERYARSVGGAAVCMLSGDLVLFDVEGAALRDPYLLTGDVRDVRGIVLTQGERTLSLTRDDDVWKGKGGIPADPVAIESWLLSLAAAEVTGFHPELTLTPRGTLTLTRAGDRTEQIQIGTLGEGGDLLLTRAGETVVTRFAPSVADRLEPISGRFASLDVWSAHQPSEVVRLDAEVPGHARTLERSGEGWRAKGGAPVDVDRVRVLVRELIDLHARSYLSVRPRPALALDKPTTKLTLALKDGTQLTLALGAETERGRAARIDGERVVEVAPEVEAVIAELAAARPAGSAPSLAPKDDEDDDDEDEHDHGHDHDHVHE
ncbi:MAG: DUF4340 domain-containing protein [Polyangiales bacterium]